MCIGLFEDIGRLADVSLNSALGASATFEVVYGHAWKARTLSGSEVQMIADLPNAGTRSMMLDVDVADLSPGTNTLELTTSNVPTSYPPVALNIDLILHTQ